jgi:hypothetical protein
MGGSLKEAGGDRDWVNQSQRPSESMSGCLRSASRNIGLASEIPTEIPATRAPRGEASALLHAENKPFLSRFIFAQKRSLSSRKVAHHFSFADTSDPGIASIPRATHEFSAQCSITHLGTIDAVVRWKNVATKIVLD